MATIEELSDQLEDLLSIFNKTVVNWKKCPTVRKSQGYLETKIKCIEEYWTAFRTAHQCLFKLTTREIRATLPYFVNDVHSECEEVYLSLRADLTDTLLRVTKPKVAPSKSGSENSEKIKADIKLPRINLPVFSGAYEEWQSFEDTFTSLIHNNNALSDVQKLHYLKSCVLGEAQNTIKHFQVTEKNYSPAWDNLKSRYSHRRLIVNALLRKLFSQKKVTMQSPSQLKTLIDNTKECINSLENMEISTSSWDPVIIFLSVQKLDQETHKAWEAYVGSEFADELPTFTNLVTFLESRIHTLELTSSSTTPVQKERMRSVHAATTSQLNCVLCKENHYLFHCKEFGKLNSEKRNEYVKENRLCYNCLSTGHSVYYCKQKTSCKICGKRHHSLLHSFNERRKSLDKEESTKSPGQPSLHANVEDNHEEDYEEESPEFTIATHFTSKFKRALLSTAIVPVRSLTGQVIMLRALIDSGSEVSFVSERATQLMKLKRSSIHGKVTGVGSMNTSVSHAVTFEVLSRYEEKFSLEVTAIVLPTPVTGQLPTKTIKSTKNWSHLDNLTLADPNYFTPGKIDMLLGVEVYDQILKPHLIRGPPGTPSALETTLGWILFGKIEDEPSTKINAIVTHGHLDIDVDSMLRNMWDIDQTTKRTLTAEERLCEDIYNSTHARTPGGRYIVKLPFRSTETFQLLGKNKDIAQKRFYQLERKLEHNRKLKKDYTKTIEEYKELNHMEEVKGQEKNNSAIYLPHHAVLREDKETTKIRIVFDASAKGPNNRSLNDELLVGPQLQEDLRSIIMRWRMKPICFVSDIQKMYRQILVTQEDADFQRILWRKTNEEEIKEYRMLRVTFGTASAPYLAVRTLMQLAEDEGNEYPEAAKILREDFYVDDCMSGSFTEKEAIELRKQLTTLLHKGGFVLQKWASNSNEFMSQIQPSLRSANADKSIKGERTIKTLGLTWNMETDSFHYHFELPTQPPIITKRNILADIQRLFDPLGWLGAAIITAKMLIQELWVQRIDWDEKVDEKIEEKWSKMRRSFKELKEVKVNRWINTDTDDTNILTIHGFCDASNKAYCAVVYSRVETMNGEIKTGIIASKTRVAPVKPVSLPRLELCGAVLLARLLTQVREAMRIPTSQVYAWTDSSVVLSWLFGDPNRWKPFVSNRVIEILDHTCNTQWFHVVSKQNPADIGSRGVQLQQLKESKLWWEGPEWLKEREINYSRPNIIPTDIERKKIIQVNTNITKSETKINFENCDNLQELLRMIVYSIRFINSNKSPEKIEKQITTEEYEDALMRCIKVAQKEEFADDVQYLKRKRNVSKNSKIKTLNPYLDQRGILRVGGRLRNSDLEEDRKHPIILGRNNDLTPFIIADAHKKTMHGGIQLLLCYLRSKYWIIRGKNAVKSYIHKCQVCARLKAINRTQIMGDLPKVRTTQSRPFLHSGVDFAGPLQVLMSKGRGAKSNKAYIAIFICMATKAIHLELVGDLTSESFIGAFQRFVARRGKCTHIWSDQGRNFVGANKDLATAWKEAYLELPSHIADKLAADGTQWHFIPPYSPNFGGLWEAGVKSVKHHLRRILTANLTFEEMATVLCQIEACLNSRPLTPIDTSNPDTVEPLTPGHFLIGEAPVNIPNPDLRDVNVHRLSRWQLTQKLVRDFWHRWQTEYLSRLQERPKWLKHTKEFEIGDIVLIKDNQLPPGKWSLGRIVNKHPGQDGITRVYSVKCGKDIIKRTILNLCAFPVDKT